MAYDHSLMGSLPGVITPKQQYADPKWVELRQRCDERLGSMRAYRWSWWTHWREIAAYLLPRRYIWLVTPNRGNRGSPINQNIIDSTGTLAMYRSAAGMLSGLTSPTRPWFKLSTNDDDLDAMPEVKAWLAIKRDRMLRVMAESNYYQAKATGYEDLMTFGTAPLIIYEDYQDVIRCESPAAGEYFCDNGPRGDVDTLYREFVLTTRQVADRFGVENCSPTVRQAMQSKGALLSQEVIVCHAIEPNTHAVPDAPGLKGYPYREVYWEFGQGWNQVLQVRGFHEKPFSVPRWSVVNNDPYGRSPGMDALGDVKQLQVMTKREAQAIDKMVNPPLLGDVSLKNEPASMLPGGVTWADLRNSNAGFKPVYQVQPNLKEFAESKAEVKERIKEAFYTDLFMMISQLDTVRTATEIDARKEEKLLMLGPVIERFQNESLSQDITRIDAIMTRAGLFPPPPPVLKGRTLKVEYLSMLVAAQRAVMTAAIERLSGFVGSLVAVKPDAMDNIDVDKTIDEYADLMGVPPQIVRPVVEVMKMRAQRADQQQAQAALQTGAAAAQGAQTLSKTQLGTGNALDAILGNVGGAAAGGR